MAFVEEAEELVEAAADGVVVSGAAKVPFADKAGGVAGDSQVVAECSLVCWESDAGVGVECADGVVLVAES